MPLKIAAKVDRADERYFREEIEPLLDHPLVEFVGEIGDAEKAAFLGGALALLFPIDWPEPFGLVMIEAMACGTPVIAFRRGSVPEVIEHGVTGFVVDSVEEAVEAVRDARPARPRGRPAALRGAVHRRADGARLRGALRAAAGGRRRRPPRSPRPERAPRGDTRMVVQADGRPTGASARSTSSSASRSRSGGRGR